MKKIKNIISKPSQAVTAMIVGLLRQNTRSDFKIDMGVYGEVNRAEKICYGCAATSCVQQLTGQDATYEGVRDYSSPFYWFEDYDSDDIADFESAIDDVRVGYSGSLFWYLGFNVNTIDPDLIRTPFKLQTEDWCCQILDVIEYRDKLIAAGL